MKRRSLWRRPKLVLLLALALACLGAPQAASAVTFVVTASDDLPGPCTGLHCTLRAAITEANAATGRDRIEFDIPPGGPQTIQPVTQLANGDGVRIQDSNGNLVGGVLAGSRNVISGNNFSGVLILGNSDVNSVEGNFIGT